MIYVRNTSIDRWWNPAFFGGGGEGAEGRYTTVQLTGTSTDGDALSEYYNFRTHNK